MRVHFSYLLWLRAAGKVNWKVTLENLYPGSCWKGLGGKDGGRSISAEVLLAQWCWVSWCAGYEVGWWLMFAVEDRKCDGRGG